MAKSLQSCSPTQGAEGNSNNAHFEEVARVRNRKLQRTSVAYGTTTGTLASCEQGRVWPPSEQAVPFELQGAPPREECERLQKFETEAHLTGDECGALLEDTNTFSECYHPPCFFEHVWCRFVKELYDTKVTHFDITPCGEMFFSMIEKNGKLRMVLSCRCSTNVSSVLLAQRWGPLRLVPGCV